MRTSTIRSVGTDDYAGSGAVHESLAATGLVVAAAAAPVVVLTALGPAAVRAATAPGADVSDLMGGLAVVLGLMLATRLVVTAAAVLLARLPGTLGRLAATVATRCTPRLLRQVVAAAVGVTLAAGPALGSGVALADPGGQPGPAFPVLDRVVSLEQVQATPPPVHERATRAVSAVRPAPTTPAAASGVVVVRPGDSLWRIAARHLPTGHTDDDVARAWPRWYAANREVIGPDPALILPGQQLRVPR